MTPEQFEPIGNMLEYGWPGEMKPGSAILYFKMLSDVPCKALISTVEALLATERYRPPVSVIREAVARFSGLLPPSVEEASVQAERYLDFLEQQQFVNGSGYEPVKPLTHSAVIRACKMIQDPHHGSWVNQFRLAYSSIVEEAKNDVLRSDMSTQQALGSGVV